MKYQCVIVEDNAVERDLLETLLRKIEDLTIVGVFENGLAALQFLQQHPVDLAFTDIDMPELSGTGLVRSLSHPPVFIFISAHSKYAADGYDLNALDFIRKPVQPERLFRAVTKSLDYLKSRESAALPPEEPVLIVRTSEGVNKLTLSTLMYVESRANYSVFYLTGGSKIMVLIGMKQLEDQLPVERFVRVHKSYLINWHLAQRIGKDTIQMEDDSEVPIGDSYRKDLAERIASYPSLDRKREK